jgi:gluconate 5-dehydrogenase
MISKIFNLTGKIALVTGSSQGLGFIFANALAEAGATVILNGRNEKKLLDTVNSLKNKGLNVSGYVFDVSKAVQVDESIHLIEKNIGSIDILVNNAGIQIKAPLEDFKEDDWNKIVNVNLTGAFLTAKAAVKGMIKKKSGKMINICSVQSEISRPTIAPYTAAKGGLKNLTKAMATEWGRYNIQVNGLGPGYFKTEMTKPLWQDDSFNTWLCSRVPLQRWGSPEELAGPIIFLASNASDYLTGHILYLDGGIIASI